LVEDDEVNVELAKIRLAQQGDEVKAGDLISRVYNIERTGLSPTEYPAGIDGIFTGRHFA
jgi:predicted deacylase